MANELHPLLQSYYAEIDPEKRKKILEEYEAETCAGASAQADAYRRDLYAARHFDKKHAQLPPDRFLWIMMNLSTIFKSPGFFPRRHKKEVLSFLRRMQLDDRPLTDRACEEVLYREYRNVIHRYYVSCSDSSYGRSLFGMVPADSGRRAEMCCNDIWGFSYGIARMVGLEAEMELLCRAASDEYCALVPEASSLDEEYRRYNKKK